MRAGEKPVRKLLYNNPRSAITNYHKLIGLKKSILSQFLNPKDLNQDVAGLVPLEALGKIHSMPLLASDGCQKSLAFLGLWTQHSHISLSSPWPSLFMSLYVFSAFLL